VLQTKVCERPTTVFMLPAKIFVLQTKIMIPLGKHYGRQSSIFVYPANVTG
jgi:hypothetical protein